MNKPKYDDESDELVDSLESRFARIAAIHDAAPAPRRRRMRSDMDRGEKLMKRKRIRDRLH